MCAYYTTQRQAPRRLKHLLEWCADSKDIHPYVRMCWPVDRVFYMFGSTARRRTKLGISSDTHCLKWVIHMFSFTLNYRLHYFMEYISSVMCFDMETSFKIPIDLRI